MVFSPIYSGSRFFPYYQGTQRFGNTHRFSFLNDAANGKRHNL